MSYVAYALDKRQTRESRFHISKKTASFNDKCWQVSKGKIKLYMYITESRCIFLRSRSKPSVLLFESRTICTHSESLVYTMERNLWSFIPFRLRLEDLELGFSGFLT